MKILIFGSEGFVGNNLVSGLTSHEIFNADMVEKSPHKNYQQLNISDSQSVQKALKGYDVVIDLVAHTLVSSIEDPTKNAQVNIIGLLNVLEACRKNDIKKIIFTSASSMIGVPKTTKVSEEHTTTPKTFYGITKLTSEHYLRVYKEMYDLNYVIFRFFNIYGPYQRNGLIPSFYSRIRNDQPLTVFGEGDQIRDYVFIEDIIPFFDKAISTKIADNSIFNMGTGKGSSIKEIIDLFSEILGRKPRIDFQPERSGEIGNFVADTSLLSKTFGKVPGTEIKEGLEKTISWLKNN